MLTNLNHNRRRFLRNAATTVAAAELAAIGPANAQSTKTVLPIQPGTRSFDSLKQIDVGLLNVGYAEAGPADARAIILLHGWPYDIHSYVDVVPLLASAASG